MITADTITDADIRAFLDEARFVGDKERARAALAALGNPTGDGALGLLDQATCRARVAEIILHEHTPGTSSARTNFDDDGKRGSGQPAPHETQQGADTPGHRAGEAAGNVADPHLTPIGRRGAGPLSSTSLTADTITDDQIRALMRGDYGPCEETRTMVVALDLTADRVPDRKIKARARCAEILSARQVTAPAPDDPRPPLDSPIFDPLFNTPQVKS